jgi:hypothetical protein
MTPKGFNAQLRRNIGRTLHNAEDRNAELKRLSKLYGVSTHDLAVMWREWFTKRLAQHHTVTPMGVVRAPR